MPSLTVVVSSDTDICFSPGLYGDCLPTVATGGAADSFRAECSVFRLSCDCLPLHARTCRREEQRPVEGERVTSTLWPSSN
ncbi:hypothetical protein E5671_15850 [Streptomyces sp. BA2]|nr:hypothetical protein [Streptomyces sp. BA2]